MRKIFLFFLFTVLSCATTNSMNFHSLSSYNYDFNSDLSSRIKPVPDELLKNLMYADNRNDYLNYTLNPEENNLVLEYINVLPKSYQEILRKKLIAVYFIENFLGNGMVMDVFDKNNEMYYILMFNKESLKKSISGLLTEKENTCYRDTDEENKIVIDCGNKYNGFLYILLHETSHIADFEKNFTPYVYNELVVKTKLTETEFTKGSWIGFNSFKIIYNHTYRSKITFYKMNGGPFMRLADAEELYSIQQASPFTSLYSNINWAEDFAEFAAFYHITQKLKQPYKISILQKKKIVFSYEPMKSEKVIKRFIAIEKIYE